MGNHNFKKYDAPSTSGGKLKKLLPSKLRKRKRNNCKTDDFFVKHCHFNKNNDKPLTADRIDHRRVVFVSLLGVFQTWKLCPSYVLQAALFILPLRRQWIYQPSKHSKEIREHLVAHISLFNNKAATKQFLNLLRWKDSQGLVFWALDDYANSQVEGDDPLVEPFWHHMSAALTKLYDPVTGKHYEPLCLEHKPDCTKSTSAEVLNELYFLKLRFKSVQRIIRDSNPESLLPVAFYTSIAVHSATTKDVSRKLDAQIYDEIELDDDETADDWWISADYDPYDVADQEVDDV